MIVVKKQSVLARRAAVESVDRPSIVRVGAVDDPKVATGIAISLVAVVLVVVLLV